MTFQPFSAPELVAYLRRVPAVQDLIGNENELEVIEVGDGNLNYVYRVNNKRNNNGLVVKQAPPFVRLVGEDWPLTRKRIESEGAALRRFGSLCPQHVPQVYHIDHELFLIVMQQLSSHCILRKGMLEGIVYPKLSEHIATYLAHTLFYGSELFLNPAEKKQAVRDSMNSELCQITEDLVFTHPFEDHPSNSYNPALPPSAIERLRTHEPLRLAAAQMKWAFMTRAETLLHGDLHTGSIMVNQDETFVIDAEFAFYGPMGFDIGAVLANFLLAYFSRDWHDRKIGREDYQNWLLDQVVRIWNGFSVIFLTLWREHDLRTGRSFMGNPECAENFRLAFMGSLLADTLGFAGCKMIRRIVGLAKVAEITNIENAAARAMIEMRCLQFAEALLVQRNTFDNMQQVVDLARRIQAHNPDR